VDFHKEQGKSAAEVVMTTLHAAQNSTVTAISIPEDSTESRLRVNALSEFLRWRSTGTAKSTPRGTREAFRSLLLRPLGTPNGGEPRSNSGADPEVFEILDFSYDTLCQRLRELSF